MSHRLMHVTLEAFKMRSLDDLIMLQSVYAQNALEI